MKLARLRRLLGRLRPRPEPIHWQHHDMQMVFPGGGLDYVLRCAKCGKETDNVNAALALESAKSCPGG
jgi:hypothetical protein